jgi:hypothetical protein
MMFKQTWSRQIQRWIIENLTEHPRGLIAIFPVTLTTALQEPDAKCKPPDDQYFRQILTIGNLQVS